MNNYFKLIVISLFLCFPLVRAEDGKEETSVARELVKQAAVGAVTGVTEVSVNQPLVWVKNQFQQNTLKTDFSLAAMREFARKARQSKPSAEGTKKLLSVLYRGYYTNAGGLAAITSVQIAADHAIREYVFGGDQQELSESQKIASAFCAGMLSGIVSSPTEMSVVHQQNSGASLLKVAGRIVKTGGMPRLYRGLVAICLRDGVFTTGYLAGSPLVAKCIPFKVESDFVRAVVGGVPAGVLSGVITQPFDTISTKMKSDVAKKRYTSTLQALKAILKEEGLRGLFSGLVPRTTRICFAIPLMSYVSSTLKKWSERF